MNTTLKPVQLKLCSECGDMYANVGGDHGGDIRFAHPRPVPRTPSGDQPRSTCPKHVKARGT